MTNNGEHKGRCLCGKIQFVVTGEPVWVGFCHCDSCRKSTGAAAVTFVGVNNTDFEFVSGTPTIFESSPGVRRGFCNKCGSPLTYDSERYDSYTQFHIGTFENPDLFSPQAHVHCSEKLLWFKTDDGLPQFSGSGDDGSADWKNP